MSNGVFGQTLFPLRGKHVYFVGAGGVSMAALCIAARREGAVVSGCDREENDGVRLLRDAGISVHVGHDVADISPTLDALVYSLAIGEDNPQLCAARACGVPCIPRPRFLGLYMRKYPVRIGVSGTHGKSTVTSMLGDVLEAAAVDATVLCGAFRERMTFAEGDGAWLVYEGCEYKDALLSFCPSDLVLLNAEWDHPDYFPSEEALLSSFRTAAWDAETRVIYNIEDIGLRRVLKGCPVPCVSFGYTEGADIVYRITGQKNGCFSFTVRHGVHELGVVQLSVAGEFQVHNAAAAFTAAWARGISPEVICTALQSYTGLARRMQCIQRRADRCVYYDYAHHPTEIRAAIRALRMLDARPLTVVFRPHTYSRTAALWQNFADALAEADAVLLTDIYAARETPIEGITSARLAEAIGKKAIYLPPQDLPFAVDTLRGCVALLGAGDLSCVLKTCNE
jgi:UDP-N-acetylmuramate--alanine ligase